MHGNLSTNPEPLIVPTNNKTKIIILHTYKLLKNAACLFKNFFIELIEAGKGPVEVIILDPSDAHKQIPVQIAPSGPGRYRVTYCAREPGLHSVNVFFGGQPVPASPYGVRVTSSNFSFVLAFLCCSVFL